MLDGVQCTDGCTVRELGGWVQTKANGWKCFGSRFLRVFLTMLNADIRNVLSVLTFGNRA